MSIPGSGTYADPYVISNWDDYITVQTTGDTSKWYAFPIDSLQHPTETHLIEGRLYVDSTGEVIRNPKTADLSTYYINPFILNANDYAPAGLTASLTTRVSFNGRGGQIRNITQAVGYEGVSPFLVSVGSPQIKNMGFNNIWSRSSSFFTRNVNDYRVYLDRCAFMGKLENLSCFMYNYSSSATSCAFNFDLENCSAWMSGWLDSTKFYYCRFNLNGSISQVRMLSYNSYFTGTVTGINSNYTYFYFYPGSQYSICDMTAYCIDAASTNDNYTHCLYNKDKISATGTAAALSADKLLGVTTADLRDADALYATGFPIER